MTTPPDADELVRRFILREYRRRHRRTGPEYEGGHLAHCPEAQAVVHEYGDELNPTGQPYVAIEATIRCPEVSTYYVYTEWGDISDVFAEMAADASTLQADQ